MKLFTASLAFVAALGTTTLLAGSASAQQIDNIGNQGQFVIGAERLMGVYWDKISDDAANRDTSTTTISLLGNTPVSEPYPGSISNLPRLAFDYFVTDNISVGGSIVYAHRSLSVGAKDANGSQDAGSENLFYIAPRAGYAYQIDETFALWPRAGFSYAHVSGSGPKGTDTSFNMTQFNIEANGVISPFQHFAIVGGPFVDIGLGGSQKMEPGGGNTSTSSGYKTTSFGIAAGIAAYM